MPLRDIEQLLNDEIGLNSATVGSDTVRQAVQERMRACGIQTIGDYRQVVRHSRTELDRLIEAVVIPETWFFRDRNPFTAFSDWLRRGLPGVPLSTPLRVLSVPCSTGEEAYTLAMCLADCAIPAHQACIDAIDISSNNLATAEKAEYGTNSFRSNDLSFRDLYFDPAGQGFRLKDTIRTRVRFTRANVLDNEWLASRESYHVIFCRNLLIYFDRDNQHEVIDKLSSLLVENGLIFLGHSETGLLKDRPFTALDFPRSFGFVHKPSPAQQEEPAAAGISKPRRTRSEPPADGSRHQALPFTAFRRDETSPRDVEAADRHSLRSAYRLADEGHLDEAALECEALLADDACQPDPYYLLGVIREASGNSEAAAELFRKALYLAPDHYEALTHLSVIVERSGDLQNARRLRERALRAQPHTQARRSER